MDIHNLTVVLLAGDPKCLNLIPPTSHESYLMRALAAVLPMGCPVILVHHPDVEYLSGSARLLPIPAGEKLFDSVAAGLTACRTEYAMLLATDLPLITAPALRDFFDQACVTEADVSIALADLKACEGLGHQTNHPIPLADGKYKFGSAFLIRREATDRILRTIKDLLTLRKQPIQLVRRFLSWKFIWIAIRFMLSYKFSFLALRFEQAEQLIEKQVGVRARGIVASPVLAIDDD